MNEHSTVDVFVGVDVGKASHHAVALDRAGTVLLNQPLTQDETALRGLIQELAGGGKRVLLVVDQPATIGALVVAVAMDEGIDVGYLPGLSMRRIADLHPGEAKTDARDAAVIAEAARSMPHALRALRGSDEQTAELAMMAGFDDDLARQVTQTITRIRGLLTQIHPALERVLGPQADHLGVADLLMKYSTPDAMKAAGRARIAAAIRKRSPRIADQLATDVAAALKEQTVVVAGTSAAGIVLAGIAQQLSALVVQRRDVARQVEELVAAHPLSPVLTSMPGMGFRTTARVLIEVSTRQFASPGHLASYAGLAPVSRRSGTSIRGEHQSQRGNKRLKRILYLSAFASLRDPASRAYYDKKRNQGKSHKQALLALARRRCDVLYAMLRDHRPYDANHAHAA